MSNRNARFLFLAAVLVLGTLLLPGAVSAIGTDSGVILVNGIATSTDGSDTVDTFGELQLSFTNVLGTDTAYSDTASTVAITVLQAWDISSVDTDGGVTGQNHSINGVGSGQPGDTIVYVVGITNLGNATLPEVIFDSVLESGKPFNSANGSYRTYIDNGDGVFVADGTDVETTFIYSLAEDASGTFYVVVTIPDTAANGDQSRIRVKVTDNASLVLNSPWGDFWQDSVPGDDVTAFPLDYRTDSTFPQTAFPLERDTQYVFFLTTVSGPVMFVGKTVQLGNPGRARPGDTIVYTIHYDNDGSGTAANLVIIDGIPFQTELVDTSASPHGSAKALVTWDADFSPGGEFSDPNLLPLKFAKRLIVRFTEGVSPDVEGGAAGLTTGTADDKGSITFTVRIQ